jgi:hypothetical protein
MFPDGFNRSVVFDHRCTSQGLEWIDTLLVPMDSHNLDRPRASPSLIKITDVYQEFLFNQ